MTMTEARRAEIARLAEAWVIAERKLNVGETTMEQWVEAEFKFRAELSRLTADIKQQDKEIDRLKGQERQWVPANQRLLDANKSLTAALAARPTPSVQGEHYGSSVTGNGPYTRPTPADSGEER